MRVPRSQNNFHALGALFRFSPARLVSRPLKPFGRPTTFDVGALLGPYGVKTVIITSSRPGPGPERDRRSAAVVLKNEPSNLRRL